MGTKNFRGVNVPAAGDDILEGITSLANTLGVIRRATSAAEARKLAEQNARHISAGSPFYVDINDILYKHTGAAFTPLGELELKIDKFAQSTKLTCNGRYYSILITSSLQRAEHPRGVFVAGTGYGNVLSGRVNLAIKIEAGGTSIVESRFDSSAGSAANSAVFNAGIIPAGVQPKITLGFRGDADGVVQTASNQDLNRLITLAFPVAIT